MENNMRARLIGFLSAGAISLAAVSTSTPSSANPALIPIIIGVAAGSLVIGAVAANANEQRRGGVAVGPERALDCHLVPQRTSRGIRRIEVCN
jgi:hypothetical protein